MTTRETTKRLLTAGAIILAVAIIVGYSYFASYGFIEGPSITITSPSTPSGNENKDKNTVVYADVSTSSIIISGNAERVSSLVLDGRPIVIDPRGNFSQTLLLFPGYNVENLQGQDRFGRITDIDFEIEYTAQ